MPTTFNLAPVPKWYFRDNSGLPLANGYMKTYRDTVRSEFKAVYSEPTGTLIYLQPITFDASGEAGPFYFASDENYYLEVYDQNDNLVFTIEHYNAPQDGGVSPITKNIDFVNYMIDSQHQLAINASITTVTTEQLISNPNWYFRKTNTDATDSISFVDFNLGDTLPDFDPKRYFRYVCSVAAVGSETYKDYEMRIPGVRSLEGQTINFSVWGRSTIGSGIVDLRFRQHFGTGGAPSPDVDTSFGTVTFIGTFARYAQTGVIASVGGKTVGTNKDDYLSIFVRLPLNAVITLDITQTQATIGNDLLPYNYQGPQLAAASVVPPWDSLNDRNLILEVDSVGQINWNPISTVDFTNMIYGGDFSLNPFQRGNAFDPCVTNQFVADRFQYIQNGAMFLKSSAPFTGNPTLTDAGLFVNRNLEFEVKTGAVFGVDDFSIMSYVIEGYDWTRLAQREFIITFLVKATVTGIYSLFLRNADQTISYVTEFTINTTLTWEKKTIVIPASPAAGNWNYTNGIGIEIGLVFGSGFNTQTATLNSWQTASFISSTNQVNGIPSVGNIIGFSLLEAKEGNVAGVYQVRSLSEVLRLCRRYFCSTYNLTVTPGNAPDFESSLISKIENPPTDKRPSVNWAFIEEMRIPPAVITYNPQTGATGSWRNTSAGTDVAAQVANEGTKRAAILAAVDTTPDSYCIIHATADADF